MPNIHESEQRVNGNGIKSVPVHDMPDFMAAVESYVEMLIGLGVPDTDANRAGELVIDNVVNSDQKRNDGNRFINFSAGLARNRKISTTPQPKG